MDEYVLTKYDSRFGIISNTVAETPNQDKQYITFRPQGVCAKFFAIHIEDGKISDVVIQGGCSGNGQALERLLIGMKPDKAIKMLEGIKCLHKETSCPDQIAQALKRLN